MPDDTTLLTIGELARLTGLTVKTIRYWSDEGLVPPADRTPAGYRLYGPDALLRLGLVRTLRDLDVDLATVHRVLASELTLAEVAEAHAAALGTRIRAMQSHRAVLRMVARRGTTTPEEIELMHKLARLSDTERRTLINDFIDDTFRGLDPGPDFLPMLRGAMPELPAEPSRQQIEAWVELAELVQDQGFRAGLRRAAAAQARSAAEVGTPPGDASRAVAALLTDRVAAAVASGITPGSPDARPVLDELVGAYAELIGRTDGPEFRRWLLTCLEASTDARYERYWQLLGTINDWPTADASPTGTAEAAAWLIQALRAG
ncbi:MerR family transcriptional regulator [Kitasatospora sp. RB6PN24]|uniref:MerR family transcriptional regulator n=1 Tax=Kitasatospora humi TaxID=2893891 RepID=UPI001E495C94|nr:MerR family transcriptional regulator [Kitasatospora humi]MCC9307494.1 MerR family transcriptional regulator [Kitasatospora humi]